MKGRFAALCLLAAPVRCMNGEIRDVGMKTEEDDRRDYRVIMMENRPCADEEEALSSSSEAMVGVRSHRCSQGAEILPESTHQGCFNGGVCLLDPAGRPFCDCSGIPFDGQYCDNPVLSPALDKERRLQSEPPSVSPSNAPSWLSYYPTVTPQPSSQADSPTTNSPAVNESDAPSSSPTVGRDKPTAGGGGSPPTAAPDEDSPTVAPSAAGDGGSSAQPTPAPSREKVGPPKPPTPTAPRPTSPTFPTPSSSSNVSPSSSFPGAAIFGILLAALIVCVALYCCVCASGSRAHRRARRRELVNELELAESTTFRGAKVPMTSDYSHADDGGLI